MTRDKSTQKSGVRVGGNQRRWGRRLGWSMVSKDWLARFWNKETVSVNYKTVAIRALNV